MLIFVVALAVFAAALTLGIVLARNKGKLRITGKILLTLSVVVLVVPTLLIGMLFTALFSPQAVFYLVAEAIFALIICIAAGASFFGVIRKKQVWIPVAALTVVCVIATVSVFSYNKYLDSIPTLSDNTRLLEFYDPYADESSVAKLDGDASLTLDGELPKMDGATALYPIYSAFAKALYPEEINTFVETTYSSSGGRYNQYKYTVCTTTPQAYQDIVDGKADIIFVAAPSQKQEEYAREQGVELVYTPIGKEAFVFFVNSKNPVSDMSLDQIRGIYSGDITHWKEFGAKSLGKIKAYQRDEGSGSQSTLEKLMGDMELMEAPKEDVIDGMGGIFTRTADYKNNKNAIGFSFRFYSNEMIRNNNIKLLSVDGVAPTEENIANGTYPIASDFYAVTRSDASENTKLLVEWILSEQGQQIIRKTGYTPILAE